MDPIVEADSDNEDQDPTKLLNQWLGELNTLKKVGYTFLLQVRLIGKVVIRDR